MSEKFRLDSKIGFQNTLYTKCINVIIDSIGPLIILRSIFTFAIKTSLVFDYKSIFIKQKLCRIHFTIQILAVSASS